MALRTDRRRNDKKAPRTRHESNGGSVSFHMITILLWTLGSCSAYIQGSQLYLLITGAATPDLLPTVIVPVVSAKVADIYLISHQLAAFLDSRAETQARARVKGLAQRLATNSLQCSVMIWLAASGLDLTFTVAKQASCESPTLDTLPGSTNKGVACVVHWTGVGAGLLGLIASVILFVLHQRTPNPFRAHLLGVTSERSEHRPLVLPYRSTTGQALFSEVPFECRPSPALSARTRVSSRPWSTAHLLPTCPEKAVMGLGIYAPPNRWTLYFLTPHPSLSSIRAQTAASSLPPPASPLPPLPAYFPDESRRTSTVEKAIHPPRPKVSCTQGVRIVPPSPAPSAPDLTRHTNRSQESLSSVYSRSVSGERRVGYGPMSPSDARRTLGSESTLGVVRSPLGGMRRARDPETVVAAGRDRRCSVSSDIESIDDAATLQPKLAQAQGVGEFGEIQGWQARESWCRRATMMDAEGEWRRLDFTPLSVRKTRHSTAWVAAHRVAGVA